MASVTTNTPTNCRRKPARRKTKDFLVRQTARRAYDAKGIDRTGKDIDHITPIRKGGTSTPGNTRLRSPKKNQADNGK